MTTTYETINDLIDQYVRPSLGEYELGYDLSGIASEIARPAGYGAYELLPQFEVASDAYDPDAWTEVLFRHQLGREKRVLRYAEGLGGWQAALLMGGAVVATCGHDDHRTRRDAEQCLDRLS